MVAAFAPHATCTEGIVLTSDAMEGGDGALLEASERE